MTFIAGVLLAYSAMVALCQGLERHYKPLWGVAPSVWRRRLLRSLGWVLLVLSLLYCVQAWGWAMGPVGWVGAMSLAGFVLVMAMPYLPRLAIGLAALGPLATVVL